MSVEERSRIEDSLRHIDDLVAGLSNLPDPAGRDTARALLEAVLDLHGLALARTLAIVAEAAEGSVLLDQLGADEQVRAVLLLYGLHPEDSAARIRRALERLRPRLAAAGATAELARVSARVAIVRLVGAAVAAELRQEVEEAVVDAAPDLDEIAVETMETEDAAIAG
ncbi:MAG TPA: hypothetical protein VFX06_10620 [Stellaceae bacterium]|nr:hypothetical protein [Stellaceae bacterium]